jgi:hypothetical protein
MSRNFYFLLTKAGGAVTSFLFCAPVAQLDRAPGFEPVGRRFESCRARQENTWGTGVRGTVSGARPAFHGQASFIPAVVLPCAVYPVP